MGKKDWIGYSVYTVTRNPIGTCKIGHFLYWGIILYIIPQYITLTAVFYQYKQRDCTLKKTQKNTGNIFCHNTELVNEIRHKTSFQSPCLRPHAGQKAVISVCLCVSLSSATCRWQHKDAWPICEGLIFKTAELVKISSAASCQNRTRQEVTEVGVESPSALIQSDV